MFYFAPNPRRFSDTSLYIIEKTGAKRTQGATHQGKTLTTDGQLLIAPTDFFDEDLLDVDKAGIAFDVPVKTNAVSSGGGGNYTPPKQNIQTLPDGVRSTVKTPAKGERVVHG